jgi:beta-carotene 3-hydroxylase
MALWIQIAIGIVTFVTMESVAWLSHKYIMHGFLWSWHKDHHKKDHDSWFERNDLFFVMYASYSIGFFCFGDMTYLKPDSP